MLIGALYRGELAMELERLGYGIEKTHADGRFEIAGVSRKAIEAFSTRRAAIVAAMEARGLGGPGANPRLAERAALMTRAHKREVDREALREHWREQAGALGLDVRGLVADAIGRSSGKKPLRLSRPLRGRGLLRRRRLPRRRRRCRASRTRIAPPPARRRGRPCPGLCLTWPNARRCFQERTC